MNCFFFLIDDAVLLLFLLMFCPWLNCQIFWRSLELWDKLKTRGASTSSTTCWREPGRSCAVSTETLFSECNERLHRAKSLCQPCQLHVLYIFDHCNLWRTHSNASEMADLAAMMELHFFFTPSLQPLRLQSSVCGWANARPKSSALQK